MMNKGVQKVNRISLLTVAIFIQSMALADSVSPPDQTLKTIDLITDPQFQRGVVVMAPPMGKKVVEAVIPGVEPGTGKPVWQLDQWNSRFSIAKAERKVLADGSVRYSNIAKAVTIGKPGGITADLILRIDSNPEYEGKYRAFGQPWPHLLVEQAIESPPLDQLASIPFHLEARLVEGKRTMGPGYTRDLHCGQVPFVLTIQNRNRDCLGFGDFLWFVVPIYDDRYRIVPPHIAKDIADPSAKLIFNPGGDFYTKESLHDGRWVVFDKDLLPFIFDALRTAWDKGDLKDSHNLRDYRISSTNLGWEATGLFAGAIEFRKLSLRAVLRECMKRGVSSDN